MLASFGNLFDAVPGDRRQEVVTSLLDTPNLKIERIASMGQRSPPGFWYDQPWAEWVIVLGPDRRAFVSKARPRPGCCPPAAMF